MKKYKMTNCTHSKEVSDVIDYVRGLLDSGRIQPGDRLPAERKLAEQLGMGRAHVRTAFQKLEFYGIVRTFPQSGTVVANQTVQVLESLISDMLQIDNYDFSSLVHVRVLLEVEAIRMCAMNRTDNDILLMKSALEDCDRYLETERRVEKDFAFHQSIARASHNPVIASLLLVITPDVFSYYFKYKVCDTPADIVKKEHHDMLRYIIEKSPEKAEAVLREHLAGVCRMAHEQTEF